MPTLVLAGDVMTGRGIDQLMPRPCPPRIYETWVRDARSYVRLAERASGPIRQGVSPGYVWGDALAEMERLEPDARIVNLETSITLSDDHSALKTVKYRMSPAHTDCLRAAKLDVCVLANNHVLDWGVLGLHETLAALDAAHIARAGAGADDVEAFAPAVVRLRGDKRLLVFAAGVASAGIPPSWAADTNGPGIAMIEQLDENAVQAFATRVRAARRPGDIVVASIHWGANWVDAIPEEHRRFAHRLIETGAADVIHGHSSHHPLAIEVHRGKLVLYGCGDLINDYEGVDLRAEHRGELRCLFGARLDDEGRLQGLEIVPFVSERLRLVHPQDGMLRALMRPLERACEAVGTRLEQGGDGRWRLSWS